MALIKYRTDAGEAWTDLLGVVGPAGPQGPRGATGPKPVKGVDYMTEEDIAAIVSEVLAAAAGAELARAEGVSF